MFYLFAAMTPFVLSNAEALDSLEQSIRLGEKKLEAQRHLKEKMMEFNDLKKKFVQEKSTRVEAWKMVKTAEKMCKLIEEERLEPIFTMEFLEELRVFSTFATKPSVSLREKGL